MKKIVANAISIIWIFLAIVAVQSESFYPTPLTYAISIPLAYFIARTLNNYSVPYERKASSKTFGIIDNSLLRKINLGAALVFSFLGVAYFLAPLVTVPLSHIRFYPATVNGWDSNSGRIGSRRSHCTRIHATIDFGESQKSVTRCIGKNFEFSIGTGSRIYLESSNSPFGTFFSGRFRFLGMKSN